MADMHTLQKMHRLHLILADEVKRICEKHSIQYFIFAGTLLGSVRHGGFIPWDDDIDMGMTRRNFDKFIQVCAQELNEDVFYLQSEQEVLYPFNFAKLRLKGTHMTEEFSKGISEQDGIFIDIFPVDVIPDNMLLRKIQFAEFWFFRNLLWVKCGHGEETQKRTARYKVAKLLSVFFSIGFLKRMKRRVITRYSNAQSRCVITSDGSYGLSKEVLERDWVENLKEYAFEDRVYTGIGNYHAYLTHMYKDYMQLPPEDKRDKHGFTDIDFGPYADM